jgi:hypothetical protein
MEAILREQEKQDPFVALLREGLKTEAGALDLSSTILGRTVGPDAWDGCSDAIREGARDRSEGVDVASAIMRTVMAEEALVESASAMIDGELALARRVEIAAWLGQNARARTIFSEWMEMGRQLRGVISDSVRQSDLSGILPAVVGALGLEEEEEQGFSSLRLGLASEAASVDVADAIMRRIDVSPPLQPAVQPSGLQIDVAILPSRAVMPAPRPWLRRLPVLALAAGLAAMLLVRILQPSEAPSSKGTEQASASDVFQISDQNDTEIEDLTVSDQAMVQVFQLDDGAPVVIFIDEQGLGNEPTEGVTL